MLGFFNVFISEANLFNRGHVTTIYTILELRRHIATLVWSISELSVDVAPNIWALFHELRNAHPISY